MHLIREIVMNLVYTTNNDDKLNKRIRLVRGDETKKEVWNRCIREAKLLVMKRDQARIHICELATEACDIKKGGGGHWSKFKDQYTVSNFAIDIGINPKTLLEWLAVKRYVYDKLNKKFQGEAKWTVMAKVRREVSSSREEIPSKRKVTQSYENILNTTQDKSSSINALKYAKNLRYTLDKNLHRMKDKQSLQQLRLLTKGILKDIDARIKEI